MALRPLDELCPSRAAQQYSPRVPSPQPRFLGKMVCSVWGGAYPRHLGVRKATGISIVRGCISHTTLSRTVNQALDLPSDTATVVYMSPVSRGGCRHGGRNRKSHGYRGVYDTSRRHVTRLRRTEVGCVPLAAVWVCCLLGAQSGVLSFYPAVGKAQKGHRSRQGHLSAGRTPSESGVRGFPVHPESPEARPGSQGDLSADRGPAKLPGKSTSPLG